MRAAWYERTGPADEVFHVGDLPVPELDAGEVRVRVHASGINPSDTKRRAGWLGAKMEHPRIIPHSDGAGIIDAVGTAVDKNRIGERVWLYNAQRGRPFGTCAEFCTLPAANAVPLPASTSFVEAACLGVPAQTAHFAVTHGSPVKDRHVLVQGGAGAVGHYAVQWAKYFGAHVIATVSSEEKAAHARAAGADHVLRYQQDDVAAVVRAIVPAGVDRIVEVDLGANLPLDVELIAPNGTIASYSSTADPTPTLPYYPLAYKAVSLYFVQAYILPEPARTRAINDITDGLSTGRLQNKVAGTFKIEDVANAHQCAENRQSLGTCVVEL